MTNDDLKRFYPLNAVEERNKDFVRYDKNGRIITPFDANSAEDVVNFRTLLEHTGGSGGNKLYMHYISEQDKIFYCRYISSSPTVLTVDTFLALLHQYPTSFIVDAKSGQSVSMGSTRFVYGLSSDGTSLTVSTYTLIGENFGGEFGGGEITISSTTSSSNYSNTAIHLTDTVTEL